MRFWDSSALVPLLVEESTSQACRELLRTDSEIAAWTLSPAELCAAIHRKARAGELSHQATDTALHRLDLLAKAWTEVTHVGLVRERACRLLAVHVLRAADSLQLGAALVLTQEQPKGVEFVCNDDRLAQAARAEGFAVIRTLATQAGPG